MKKTVADPNATDITRFLGIGTVVEVPKIKYVPKTESWLVEFLLSSQVPDPLNPEGERLASVMPVAVRRQKLALYLKDVLQPGLRLYIEGTLVPRSLGRDHSAPYHIDLKEVELIDTPVRPEYPSDIKRIDR